MKNVTFLLVGALVGGLVVWLGPARAQEASRTEGGSEKAVVDFTTLSDDVARLKNVTPNQSHVMADAAFQYANLWFAGQKKNWPLAMFYYNETRGRIRWLLRLNPTPKTPDGEVVNLQGIFDAIDSDQLAKLKDSIDKKDSQVFEGAYKDMLQACYTCHKSAGRPYLRPMVPTTPPQTIINYSPDATWPQ